jgi:hypothetical protein
VDFLLQLGRTGFCISSVATLRSLALKSDWLLNVKIPKNPAYIDSLPREKVPASKI